jgi:hypothetical protein
MARTDRTVQLDPELQPRLADRLVHSVLKGHVDRKDRKDPPTLWDRSAHSDPLDPLDQSRRSYLQDLPDLPDQSRQ